MVSRVAVEGELTGNEVESHSSGRLQINEVNTELCWSHRRKRWEEAGKREKGALETKGKHMANKAHGRQIFSCCLYVEWE